VPTPGPKAQAKPKAKPFYQEVLDAIEREEKGRVVLHHTDPTTGQPWKSAPIGGWALPYLRTVLVLCQAVEAEDAEAVKTASAELLQQNPPGLLPYQLSEELSNELIARTLIMGLEPEAARLKPWLREHDMLGSSPYSHAPDERLWELTAVKAVERAQRPTPSSAPQSLDVLLRTFKAVFREAAALDDDALSNDRSGLNSSPRSESISAYEDDLIEQLRRLHEAIQRCYEVVLEGATAELESGRGGLKTLAKARELLDKRIAPVLDDKVVKRSSKGTREVSPSSVMVDVTRSVPRKHGGVYVDALLEGAAARKRSIGFTFYDPKQESGAQKQLGIDRVLAIRREQLKFLAELYGAGNGGLMKGGMHVHSDDDWRKLLLAKFNAIRPHTKDDGEALTQVIELLQRYLAVFTIHTPYNIDDFGDNYLTTTFPRALTGQLVHDCGVYALRIAYALSLLRGPLKLRFGFVRLPVHVALVITGEKLPMYVVNNDTIQPVGQKELEDMQVKYARASGGKLDERAFVGDVAAAFFLPFVDMPERVVNAKITSDTKAAYWEVYKSLQPDVLKPAKGDLAQFHLRYLDAMERYKLRYNDTIRPFWNIDARGIWRAHRKRLLEAFDSQRREGTKDAHDAYMAACDAYRTALEAKLIPVESAMEEWHRSAADISETLHAHRGEFLAPNARAGHARRTQIGFDWAGDIQDYFAELAKTTDLTDPDKRDRLVPPFERQPRAPWD
jgi:hypothetical protein